METQAEGAAVEKKRWAPTVEDCVVFLAGVVGLIWAFVPVGDNTFFVHLRTGIDIWRTHTIPSVDPYSYTANGQEWILQSWLAEVVYGAVHALGGIWLVVTMNCFLLGFVALMLARFARTGRMTWTFLYIVMTIILSCSQWSNRPTTFAFVLFALLIAVQKRAMWLTALLGLIWINFHGSWPLAILWLGAVAVGASIDERRVVKPLFARLFLFVVATVVGGALNPIGWKLLTFPMVAFEKGSVFANIVEWKSPDFHSMSSISGGISLPVIVIALFLLVHMKVSWRHSVPVIGLLALSLYSQRNLPFFALALAFSLGVITREHFARQEAEGRPAHNTVRKWGVLESFAMMLVVMVPVLMTARLAVAKSPLQLSDYPVVAMAYAETLGFYQGDQHLLAPDVVGCLRILQAGDQANVFIDDRYDMYPKAFERDAFDIFQLKDNAQGLLDTYKVNGVLIRKGDPLRAYLSVNQKWTQTFVDKKWVLYVRTDGSAV